MARYRTIKPEFWTSDQILNCSRDARLLFIGLWNFANDKGVIVNSEKSIKAKIFPADDDILVTDINKLTDELIYNKLIMPFLSGEVKLLYITGWSRHQKIDRPAQCNEKESTPAVDLIEEFINSTIIRRSFDEYSTNTRRALDTERKKEKERKSKERIKERTFNQDENSVSAEQAQPWLVSRKNICKKIKPTPEIIDLFNFWVLQLGKPAKLTKLDYERAIRLEWGLNEYGREACENAIIGCTKSAFHMGIDPAAEGKRHDDITLIFRDTTKVEQFLGYFNNVRIPTKSKQEIELDERNRMYADFLQGEE